MNGKSGKSVKKPAARKQREQATGKHKEAKEKTVAQPANGPALADDTAPSDSRKGAGSGGSVDAVPTEVPETAAAAPASGQSRRWLTDGNVTRFISVLALLIASASLAYIISIERNGGLLANSARAVMAKAGIGAAPTAPDKATMLSSIQYLSSAARGSEPFSTELAVTYKMVGDHPEIGKVLDEILPGAETGIPSVEDVTTSYADIISEIYGYGPGQLLGQAASSITSIVGIKTSAQQRQATIEQVTVLVAAGKLEQALQALNKLDGQSRLPFAAWQIKAQRRVALDAAVSEIKRIAFLSILDGAS